MIFLADVRGSQHGSAFPNAIYTHMRGTLSGRKIDHMTENRGVHRRARHLGTYENSLTVGQLEPGFLFPAKGLTQPFHPRD